MELRHSTFLKVIAIFVTLAFSGCKSRDMQNSRALDTGSDTMDELDFNGCFRNRTGRVIDRSPPLGFANCHDGKVLMLTSEGDFQGVQVAGQDINATEVSWEDVSRETSKVNMEGDRLVSAELKLHQVVVKGKNVNEAKRCLGLVKIFFPTQADKADGSVFFYYRRNEHDRTPEEIARFLSCKFENMSTFNRFRDAVANPSSF